MCVLSRKYCGLRRFRNLFIICWAMWKEICKHSHVPQKIGFFQVDWVYAYAENIRYQRVQGQVDGYGAVNISDQSWSPPPFNHFRLDVDAAFDSFNNKYSVGVVICDYQGLLCGAKANLIRNSGYVEGEELLAIRCGLIFV